MHEMIESLERHIGKTVTIFTESGGLSGDAVIIGLSWTNLDNTGFRKLSPVFITNSLKGMTNK